MKFSKELIKETGTILAFSCVKDYKTPLALYVQIIFWVILSLITREYLLLLITLLPIILFRKQVIKETLYVMKGLGLQISKFSRDGSITNHFIDNSEIREVAIKESLTPYNVRINIAIILAKASKLIIPFNDFEITLKEAKQIYKATRTIFLN